MDFVNKLTGSGEKDNEQQAQSSGGGFMDKLNAKAGGGRESEKNEDALDKGTYVSRSSALVRKQLTVINRH